MLLSSRRSQPFPDIALFIVLAILLSSSLPARASGEDCPSFLRGIHKTRNLRAAEEILQQYEPFRSEGFTLRPLHQEEFKAVFLGTHPKRPYAPPFVIKVAPLHDALNDSVALRAIRRAQEKSNVRIKIIKGTLLTPRSNPIELTTLVIQINEFIEGTPLIEVLADPKVDPARKQLLKARFNNWTEKLQPGLKQEGFLPTPHQAGGIHYQKHETLLAEDPELLKDLPESLLAVKTWRQALKENASFNRRLERLSQGTVRNMAEDFEDILIALKVDNLFVNDANELILFDPF
jgi:hypothetical protein